MRSGYSESRPGVEPPHPAGLVLPEAVQECLHPRHPVTLPGLHLGGRPVDGVDLRPGAHAAEEVIAGAAVVLEEPVAFDVVDDAVVPAQGLFAVEVPPHDQAAAAAQQLPRPGRVRSGFDVRKVDDGPDHLTALPRGGDLADFVSDLILDDSEDFLDGAARRGDTSPECRLGLPDGARQVRGRLFPVRQCGQRGSWNHGTGRHDAGRYLPARVRFGDELEDTGRGQMLLVDPHPEG